MLGAVAELVRGPARSDEALRRLSRRAADFAAEGRHAAAARVWSELAQLEPDHAGVARGLGAALLGAGQNQQAALVLAKACQRHPDDLVLLQLHAQALTRLGDSRSAVGALYLALHMDPASITTQAALAQALQQQRRPEAALPYAESAFRAEPTAANVALLTGILFDLNRQEEALAVVETLPSTGPELASKHLMRLLSLQFLGRDAEALQAARDAQAVAPENHNVRCGLAMALLLRGELTAEAWSLYESRAGLIGFKEWPSPELRWTGGDIAGRTLLVHAEQGYGDTIQFARYLPLVAERGARVILAVQPVLLRLMEHVPGADIVIAGGGAELPPFDLYVPLLSLPGIVGTTLETIPPPLAVPVPPPLERPDELQAGLVWAGNGVFVDDARRSVAPEFLAPLSHVAGVTFHSLQFGATTLPLPGMHDAMAGVTDFADTAERIAALDLVIAVDTSVAHLAASMGKPVWLLSRRSGCWRWLQDRVDSPWYPSVRIYRQPRLNDWTGVIDAVRRDLEHVVATMREIRSQAA